MSGSATSKSQRIQFSSDELIGIAGFSCSTAWMLLCFYGLFANALFQYVPAERSLVQAFVFIGSFLGYIGMHLAGKNERFNPFRISFFAIELILMMIAPLATLLVICGITFPLPVYAVINLVTGAIGTLSAVMWIDVCTRMRKGTEFRFVSISLFVGALLFGLVVIIGGQGGCVCTMIFGIGCVVLKRYASRHASLNENAAPVTNETPTFKASKEVEPLMVGYGIVFGMCFTFLFIMGGLNIAVGMVSVAIGSGIIALLSFRGHEIGITAISRVTLIVSVLACVAMPFAEGALQTVVAGLVAAAWAAVMTTNYALVAQKTRQSNAAAFRQLPIRLSFRALGFLIGWLLATGIALAFGEHNEVFGSVHLVIAVALVALFVVLMPSESNHREDKPAENEHADESSEETETETENNNEPESEAPTGDGAEGETAPAPENPVEAEPAPAPAPAPAPEPAPAPAPEPVITVDLSESELFNARCAAVAKLYGLSPRETDILVYLARGRNVAYIQDKLFISPHTVKSHVYSIYRKLDIHSQQKLMDFVEEFPINQL